MHFLRIPSTTTTANNIDFYYITIMCEIIFIIIKPCVFKAVLHFIALKGSYIYISILKLIAVLTNESMIIGNIYKICTENCSIFFRMFRHVFSKSKINMILSLLPTKLFSTVLYTIAVSITKNIV